MRSTVLVVGSGPSVTSVRVPPGVTAIACNRSIEVVPARYWIWVDGIHYERSRAHPHAEAAERIGPDQALAYARPPLRTYRIARTFPCAAGELYLEGGTLSVAAHFALGLGCERLVFAACDALDGRDRYHAWDGATLPPRELEEHRRHLERTAEAVRTLARAYPGTRFEDATPGSPVLGLSAPADLEEFRMTTNRAPIPRDESLPRPYGRLVAVTPIGEGVVALWLDNGDEIRCVRAALDASGSLALAIKDQALITRS